MHKFICFTVSHISSAFSCLKNSLIYWCMFNLAVNFSSCRPWLILLCILLQKRENNQCLNPTFSCLSFPSIYYITVLLPDHTIWNCKLIALSTNHGFWWQSLHSKPGRTGYSLDPISITTNSVSWRAFLWARQNLGWNNDGDHTHTHTHMLIVFLLLDVLPSVHFVMNQHILFSSLKKK